MLNIGFEYKYKSISEISKIMQVNNIIDYLIILGVIISIVIICSYLGPKYIALIKDIKQEKEKKKKKDKLKYLSLQNEIQTEIEERFKEEDQKEVQERINKFNDI